MDEKHLNPSLYQAVETLKSKRIIKKDVEIVEKTGFDKSVVSNYLVGRVKASKNFLDKFNEVFGPYLENKVFEDKSITIRSLKAISNGGKIKNIVSEAAHEYQMAKPVPYFDIDVSASNIEMFTDERELPTKAISIKGVEDCDFGVPIFGSSMYPTYENGTIIFCKRISDFDVLQYGEPHLIITKEQRFVKRILKGPDKSTVTLSSDNTDARDRDGKRRYENFEIPKNKILHLFIIKASYKRGQL